ncbi:MAG: rhomboid family intramembrane serine protease [Phycisphaerales bacterium]
MLIPLGTERPLQRPTLVTFILIALNVVVFVATTIVSRMAPEAWASRWLPALWIHGEDFHAWGLVTSTFLHGDWLHLIGNMVVLWVFGQNVEDRFGRWWFVVFYLVGGVAASGLHALFEPSPAIGASGAIAAVTGAFLVLFPRTHVKCLVFFFFIGIFSIPAWWFIAFAMARDFVFSGLSDGVAHLAHIGGYIFGATVSIVLLWRRVLEREPYDLFTIGRQAYRRRQFREMAGDNGAGRGERARRGASEPAGEVAIQRGRVGELLGSGKTAEAAAEYRALVERYGHVEGATTLSRQAQMDIANYYFSAGDHASSAYAYERFLEAYPKDSQAAHARLMLGLINARYLNDPVRAKAVLSGLAGELRDASERELAQRLLDDIG